MIGHHLATARKWLVFIGQSDHAESWSFTATNLAVVSCLAIIDQQPVNVGTTPGVGITSGLCFLLTAAMPLVGACVLLGMASLESDPHEKRYGPVSCSGTKTIWA